LNRERERGAGDIRSHCRKEKTGEGEPRVPRARGSREGNPDTKQGDSRKKFKRAGFELQPLQAVNARESGKTPPIALDETGEQGKREGLQQYRITVLQA